MANTGKNKIVKWMRIYANGYNLSGDARVFSELLNGSGEVDMTGWSNSIKQGMVDTVREVGIRGFQALLNDTANSGAFSVLKTPGTAMEISLLLGGGAEPTYGDPAYLLWAAQIIAQAGWDGGAATISADFIPQPGQSAANPWGYVLGPAISRPASFTGTAHNNGAATANGFHANIHITASSSGNFALILEDSATGAFAGEETLLGTFTTTGGAIGSEHLTGAGEVLQYVRLKGTRTAGTITPVVTFARN